MRIAAAVIALLITTQGLFGLAAPDHFLRLVQAFQVPPVIYLAAIVRIAFGLVLLRVATRSRLRIVLRLLGAFMVAGGVLTPFVGASLAQVILGWWSAGGAPTIRLWATASVLIGLFIALAIRRHAPAGGTTGSNGR